MVIVKYLIFTEDAVILSKSLGILLMALEPLHEERTH